MAYVVLNNAKSTLATALMIGDTSAAVQSGDGALFAVGSNYSYLVLEDDAGHREVIKLTARASDALTIERAQDGTTERDWNIGDIIECRPCRSAFEALKTENATHAASEKTALAADDEFAVADSADSYGLKKAKYSTVVAFQASGTGAILRTLQEKLLELFRSITDFGASTTGTELQKALDAAAAGGGVSQVLVPRDVVVTLSAPIDMPGGVELLLHGRLISASGFASAVMDDGNTSSAMVYIGETADGAAVVGDYRNVWHIDCRDSGGSARADYAVQITGNAGKGHRVENLLCAYAKNANIRVDGTTLFTNLRNIYSAWSPRGYDFHYSDGTGASGPVGAECCYAVQCGVGYYVRNSHVVGKSLAADQCGLALQTYGNAHFTCAGFTAEGSGKLIDASSDSWVSIDGGLCKDPGTAAVYSASSYSGNSAPPASPTGVYLMSLSDSVFSLSNFQFSTDFTSVDRILNGGSNSKVRLSNLSRTGPGASRESLYSTYFSQFSLSATCRFIDEDSDVGPVEYTGVVTCGTSGTVTLDASYNTLAYVQRGPLITVTGNLAVASVSSPVGYFAINLPKAFAALTENADRAVARVIVTGTNAANVKDFVGIIAGSEIDVYLGDATGLQSDSAQELKAGTNIYISATYIAEKS